jgi:hypothetical protein
MSIILHTSLGSGDNLYRVQTNQDCPHVAGKGFVVDVDCHVVIWKAWLWTIVDVMFEECHFCMVKHLLCRLKKKNTRNAATRKCYFFVLVTVEHILFSKI